MIKQGQNKIFRALIWGKVGLCRPKMTRDMIKKKKQGFSKNVNLCYKIARKCKIWHFLKITVFTFFIISLVIFGLQRRTLHQIEALKILFWPYFIIFSLTINICWAIMSGICISFFTQSIELRKRFSSDILILSWFDNFFFLFWQIFAFYTKVLMHMISQKKDSWIWYHFIDQNFQIHFVNVFFYSPSRK